MANIFAPYILGTYRLLWSNAGAGTFGLYTTPNFPQGTNVYATTAIANLKADDNAVAANNGISASAFIYQWSVYGAGGQITQVPSPADPFLHGIYINDCANITFGAFAGGGRCGTTATVFRR